MPSRKLMLLGGLSSALISLPYIFDATEREGDLWGLFSLGLGFGLMAMSTLVTHHKNLALIRLLTLGFAMLAVLQLIPIQLWFALHGYALSASQPPTSFVTHWAYALPHMLVLALSLAALYQLCHRLLTE